MTKEDVNSIYEFALTVAEGINARNVLIEQLKAKIAELEKKNVQNSNA